jgi:hypothetical protein
VARSAASAARQFLLRSLAVLEVDEHAALGGVALRQLGIELEGTADGFPASPEHVRIIHVAVIEQ